MMFKKCLASLAALSIVAACIPSALAAETQTVPSGGGTIQFEDLFDIESGAIGSDENADGGKYVLFGNSDSKPEYETTFNVTETGVYTVDFLANRGSSQVTTSGVKMYINDMLVLDTFESDGYNKFDNVYPNESYEILDFYGNSSIYLTAGSHKIKFDYYSPNTAGGKYRYAADCIKFEKVQPVTLPEDGVIEFEEFFYLREGLLWENENASGGKFLYNPYGSSEGIDYHHNVLIVPEEGDYSVHMIAGRKWNPAFVSKCSLFIDGKEVVNNQVSETELSPRYPVGDEYDPYAMADHIGSVHLTQGEHTVGFKVYPAPSNNNYLNFSLDCIKFVKSEAAELTNGSIEFEDLFDMSELTQVSLPAASGETVYQADGTEAKKYVSYLKIDEEDNYDVSYIATAEDESTTLSTTKLYIDDEYVAGSQDGINNPAAYEGTVLGSYNMKEIKNTVPVPLSAGSHRVEFEVVSNSSGTAKFAVDSIKIQKKAAAELKNGSVEFEEVFGMGGTALGSLANASGGSYISVNGSTILSYTGRVNIPKEAKYTVSYVGTAEEAKTTMSRTRLYVDGRLVADSYDAIGNSAAYDGKVFYDMFDMKKIGGTRAVSLTEGEHTLRFELLSYSGGSARFAVDNISFTEKEVPAVTDGKLEFEDVFDMSDLNLVEDEKASGGKYLFENGIANTLNYKGYFNVPESGCYDISYISTAEEARITLSDSELYIDGTYINDSHSAISSEPYSDIAFHGLYYMKKIKGYNAVYLEKGIHQAEFALRANGGTNVKFLADCIQFTKRNVTEIEGTIQAEDLFGVDEVLVVDNANASGGKVVNGDWSSVKEFGGEINVTEEGTYNIEFVGSKAGGNSYVSCGTMYIDGTEVFSQAGSMNDRGELVYSLGDGDWCKVCKYNLDPVYLSEGKHSIKMVYTYPTSDTSKGIRWALDTLTFTKDNTEEVFETNLDELEPYYSEYGTNDERVIVYRNGVEIQNGSTYQITYASSNENVITIDGNGTIILGGKTGYSEISVVISRGGRVVSTLFGSLYVIDDNVVYSRHTFPSMLRSPYHQGEVPGEVMTNDKTIVFSIPDDIEDMGDEDNYDVYYSLRNSDLENGEYYSGCGYVTDNSKLYADAVVVAEPASKSSTSSEIGMFDKIYEGLDNDDNVVNIVHGMFNDSETSYVISEKNKFNVEKLQKGDVILYSLSKGEMVVQGILYRYTDNSGILTEDPIYLTGDSGRHFFSNGRVLLARPYRIQDDTILLAFPGTEQESELMYGLSRFYTYNDNKFNQIYSDDIKTYEQYGEDADYVVIHQKDGIIYDKYLMRKN